ncbi:MULTISPECIES: Tad domain-containing protein [unclassified Streptomyces]|uniref:Tad domain-containing protein n=1 Tax=unclassified Streptomyces TaxID=2593676 RepID=UPI000CD5773F|nr:MULTISPECIES: TadE/TadG family type IV pilus assembly protein [unclassified Streptomyces]
MSSPSWSLRNRFERVVRVPLVRAEDGRGTERGSAAIVVVIFAFTLITLAAFVVDGGMAISNRERAADIAEQAARYAAQDLDEDRLRDPDGGGAGAPINHANCDARVAQFVQEFTLTSASVTDHDCFVDLNIPDEVTVEIVVTYRPLFSSVFTDNVRVVGTATAVARTG